MRCCLIQQRKITIYQSSLHVYMPLTVDTCGFVCENGKSVIFHPNSSLINDLVWGFFNIFTLFSLINEVFHALTLILPVFRSARSVHRRLVQVSMLFFLCILAKFTMLQKCWFLLSYLNASKREHLNNKYKD